MRYLRTLSGDIISIDFIGSIRLVTLDNKVDIVITTKDNKQFVFNTLYKSKKYISQFNREEAVDYIEIAKQQMDGLSDVVRDEGYNGQMIWYDSFLLETVDR